MSRKTINDRDGRRWRASVLAVVLAICGVRPAPAAALRLVAIEPTVLLARENDILLQVAEVVVENTEGAAQAVLEVRPDSGPLRTTPLGTVKPGKASFQVQVPSVSSPAPVEFILKVGATVQDRRTITWQPQRRWEVCLVPISHHDLGYTQPIEEVLGRYEAFYDAVLRFCQETDDWPEEAKFRYTAEGAWSIDHYLRHRPKEVVDKLAKYVREGRIEIPALVGNEVTNLCDHEELIRLMYPSLRIKRQLGATICTGSITDIPGLSWGLPTVLSGAGAKYFFAGLPTYFEWGRSDIHTFWDEAAILRHGRPDAFRWEGPDGQSVLVFYQGSYGCWSPGSYEAIWEHLPGTLAAIQKAGCPLSVMRYGCSGCGDNTPPDLSVSRAAREWNAKWAYPKLIVATNTMFFERLEKQCGDVRVFRGELPDTDYVVGATSTAEETGINRLTHRRLHAAEALSTIAHVLAGHSYPAGLLSDAYDNAMLYDEHTWGMAHQVGRVQDWNWSDKSRYAYKAAGLSESVLDAALHALSERIGLEDDGPHVVVFNPLSFRRTDVVRLPAAAGQGYHRIEVVAPPAEGSQGLVELVDLETGKRVPGQMVEIGSPQAPAPYAAQRYARGRFHRAELFELVFVAEDVPPMGYKTYRVVPPAAGQAPASSLVVGDGTVENRFYKITLDAKTGALKSLYDKLRSREIVDSQAPHQMNQLVVKSVPSGKLQTPEGVHIHQGPAGPVCASLVVSGQAFGCPQVIQQIVLYDNLPRIELANRVLKDSTPLVELYFAFPFKMDKPEFRFEGAHSVIQPLVDQFPGSNSNYYTVQHWADVSDGQSGATLSAVESHLMEFGGLWPNYCSQAHHGLTAPDFGRPFVTRDELTNGSIYAFVLASNFRTNFPPLRQGDLLFRYAIGTHQGGWKEGRAPEFGWGVCHPLLPVALKGKKSGSLGKTMSFCQVEPANVFLLTLKQAEDGDGILLRLIETTGQAATANVTLPHVTITKAFRANLVEENQSELPGSPHQIAVPITPFQTVTLRIHYAR